MKYRDRIYAAAFAYKEGRMSDADLMEVIDTVIAEIRERAEARKAEK